MKKISFLEQYFPHLILCGIIMILVAGVIAYSEFHGAESFCKSINGTYKFELMNFTHYCNNGTLVDYTQIGWQFERKPIIINLTTQISP